MILKISSSPIFPKIEPTEPNNQAIFPFFSMVSFESYGTIARRSTQKWRDGAITYHSIKLSKDLENKTEGGKLSWRTMNMNYSTQVE